MIRRSLAGFLGVAACGATLLLAVAPIVRWTVRDRVPGLSLIFYASPWPVIAFGAALCAYYWFRHARRFMAAVLAMECLAALAGWLSHDWQWRASTDIRGELRVVHWNVDRPNKRQAGTMRWLAAQDADIIAVAERQPKTRNTMRRWRAAFPDYESVTARGETLCLVRGQVLSVSKELRDDGSYATVIRTRVRDQEVTVLQVDLNGNLTHDRTAAVKAVRAIVDRHRAEHLILLGDFNTPADSALLAPLRSEMVNTFEAVGSGCQATWPMPFPVLSLDQVWTSSSLRPVHCEHVGSWRSDHRAVVVGLDFVPRK